MGKLEQRSRNIGKKQRKSIVAIGCEGENKTERTYFSNFASRDCIIKLSTGNKTDPIGMARELISFINKEDIKAEYGDKVYLVLDTDVNQNKQEQINEAKLLCEKNNIELITTTPTFEFWYILHFEYTTKIYHSSRQVKEHIKSKINSYSESLKIKT